MFQVSVSTSDLQVSRTIFAFFQIKPGVNTEQLKETYNKNIDDISRLRVIFKYIRGLTTILFFKNGLHRKVIEKFDIINTKFGQIEVHLHRANADA